MHFEGLSYIDHACLEVGEATGGSRMIDWEGLTAKFRQPGTGHGMNDRQASEGEPGQEQLQ